MKATLNVAAVGVIIVLVGLGILLTTNKSLPETPIVGAAIVTTTTEPINIINLDNYNFNTNEKTEGGANVRFDAIYAHYTATGALFSRFDITPIGNTQLKYSDDSGGANCLDTTGYSNNRLTVIKQTTGHICIRTDGESTRPDNGLYVLVKFAVSDSAAGQLYWWKIGPGVTISASQVNMQERSATFSWTCERPDCQYDYTYSMLTNQIVSSPTLDNTVALSNLVGKIVLSVRATNYQARGPWVQYILDMPPETSITEDQTTVTPTGQATFYYSCISGGTGCQLQYALDSGDWSARSADTSHTFSSLAGGDHIFKVRASTPAVGPDAWLPDPTPASQTFTIPLPQTTITSVYPPGETSESSLVAFNYDCDATGYDCEFSYRIDGRTSWSDWSLSKQAILTLSNGVHTFEVKARLQSVEGPPALTTANVQVPSTPSTTIVSKPSDSASTTANFVWGCTMQGVSNPSCEYSYRLDGAGWSDWDTTKTLEYNDLPAGLHVFDVKSRSSSYHNLEDKTGARATWTVTAGGPAATITTAPADQGTATNARFNYVCNQANCQFNTKLDSGAWSGWNTNKDYFGYYGVSYSGLSAGQHTFYVRAKNANGEQSESSATTKTWTVSSGPPKAVKDLPKSNYNITKTQTFVWHCDQDNCQFSYQLDSSGFSSYSGDTSKTYDLSTGAHTFEIKAKNANGEQGTPTTKQMYIYDASLAITKHPPEVHVYGAYGFSEPDINKIIWTCTGVDCSKNSVFRYRVDGGAWYDMLTSQTTASIDLSYSSSFSGYALGTHTFEVKRPLDPVTDVIASWTWKRVISFCKDSDGDRLGDPSQKVNAESWTPPQGTTFCSDNYYDCDDSNRNIGGPAIYYSDSDGDSYGNPDAHVVACTQPSGYVINKNDCDDTDTNAKPGAAEVCDGKDNNCNGLSDDGNAGLSGVSPFEGGVCTTTTACGTDRVDCTQLTSIGVEATACVPIVTDNKYSNQCQLQCQGDYTSCGTSCYKPANGACSNNQWACNSGYRLDTNTNSCNEFCQPSATRECYTGPANSDGVGVCRKGAQTCSTLGAWGSCSNQILPTGEVCDGLDNNCDGLLDDGADGRLGSVCLNNNDCGTAHVDCTAIQNDASKNIDTVACIASQCKLLACDIGFEDANNNLQDGCEKVLPKGCTDFDRDGYKVPFGGETQCGPTDCDDRNGKLNPGRAELCDGIDNNCDGKVDADAFNAPVAETKSCGVGICSGGTQTRECTDATFGEWSACEGTAQQPTTELCNKLDDNCDGVVDDPFDADRDGFVTNVTACRQAYANTPLDCNDNAASAHPGAAEMCNGVDDDCDGIIDNVDGSTDTIETACACSGQSAAKVIQTKKHREELNKIDDNCDGKLAAKEVDKDMDGFALYEKDCNDKDDQINPEAKELCSDRKDNNCDGVVNEGCAGGPKNVSIFDQALAPPVVEAPAPEAPPEEPLTGLEPSEPVAGAEEPSIVSDVTSGEEVTQPKGTNFVLVAAVIAVLLIGGAVGFMFWRKQQTAALTTDAESFGVAEPTAEAPPQEVKRNMSDFISSSVSQGYSATNIKETLKEKGWSDEDIEDAMEETAKSIEHLNKAAKNKGLSPDKEAGLKSYISDMKKKGFSGEQIKAALVNGGWDKDAVDKYL
jgi:hypothetical protein